MTASPLVDLSPQDLDELAESIVIPCDLPFSARARAFIDVAAIGSEHRPQDQCTHTTVYQPVFSLEGGRRDVPAGPAFRDRASAAALVRLLNHAGDRDAAPSPEPAEARTCVVCDTPLPPGSRAHRTTCGETCRQRLARERRQAAQTGGRPPAATALRPGVGGGGAAGSPAGECQTTPTESVTARPAAPAAQLELFDPILDTKMDPAAVVTPAGSGTDEDHDRTHPS